MMNKIFIVILGCLLVSCSPLSVQKDIPTIVTSFYPITFLVERLVGEEVSVVQILPDGSDIHEYEPTSRDLATLHGSDLILFMGILEPYVADIQVDVLKKNIPFFTIFSTLPFLNIINSPLYPLRRIKGEFEGSDPHVWLSPRRYLQMLDVIYSRIDSVLDLNMDDTLKNTQEALKTLDHDYTEGLKNCRTKEFITGHASFGYLSQDYGLLEIPVTGLSGEEPSPKEIADFVDLIKTKQPALFAESKESEKIIGVLSLETGREMHILSTLEFQGNSSSDYFHIMRANLSALRVGLGCE